MYYIPSGADKQRSGSTVFRRREGSIVVIKRGRGAVLWLGEGGKQCCGWEREGSSVVVRRGRVAALW